MHSVLAIFAFDHQSGYIQWTNFVSIKILKQGNKSYKLISLNKEVALAFVFQLGAIYYRWISRCGKSSLQHFTFHFLYIQEHQGFQVCKWNSSRTATHLLPWNSESIISFPSSPATDRFLKDGKSPREATWHNF